MLKLPQILVFLVVAGPAAGQSLADRLDAYLRPYAEADYFSGTVLVARGDSVLYERSFGWANRELGVPFTPETRSNVASITKPMTIALLARMAEAGLIGPDQTIDTWLPDFPRADRITVSHLLNHRAGIPHRVTTPEQETVPHTAADMVAFAAAADTLPHAIGAVSVYSSGGYSVLARVLELAGGADYATLLARYVTGPAGMAQTAHVDGRTVLPGRAAAYTWSPAGLGNAPLQDLSFLVGAGSVYSTPRDLFRMMRALVRGDLGDAAQMALLRPGGLEWNGSTSGFRAWADWERASDLTVILVANQQSGVNDIVRQDLPPLVAGETLPSRRVPDVRPAQVPVATLAWLDGEYERPGGSPLAFAAADGGAWFGGTWWLFATSDSTFFSPNDFGVVTARTDPDGSAVLVWEAPAYSVEWRRR